MLAALLTTALALPTGAAPLECPPGSRRDARAFHSTYGYPTVVTDWRVTNLLSSRTWPRLGWLPTFYRLYRAIA